MMVVAMELGSGRSSLFKTRFINNLNSYRIPVNLAQFSGRNLAKDVEIAEEWCAKL